MACSNKRRYYVVSNDDRMCYGYNPIGRLTVIENLPWSKPYLFYGVKQARAVATKLGYMVKYWPGRVTVNHPSDNAE